MTNQNQPNQNQPNQNQQNAITELYGDALSGLDTQTNEILDTEEKKDDKPALPPVLGGFGMGEQFGEPFVKLVDYLLGREQRPETDFPVTIKERTKINAVETQKRIEEIATAGGFNAENVDIDGVEVADLLGVKGLSVIGFAENDEQFFKALNNTLGEGKYKVLKDDEAGIGQTEGFLPVKYYISAELEDGSYTKFSPVSPNSGAVMKRFLASAGFDVVADSGTAATALAAATYVGVASGPAGIVTGPLVFLLVNYQLTKGTTKVKQFIQEELNLKEDKANNLQRVIDGLIDTANPTTGLVLFDSEADEDRWNQNFNALLGTLLAKPGYIKDTFTLVMDRARKEGLLGAAGKPASQFKAALRGQMTAEKFNLPDLLLPQIDAKKIIQRLSALSEQTSLVIPKILKEQNQQAMNYLKNFTKNLGEGNFKSFRQNVLNINTYITSLKNKISKTGETPERLGIGLAEAEEVFKSLYRLESLGLYNRVFKPLKSASYDLSDIVKKITTNPPEIIAPVTPAGVVKTADVKYDFKVAANIRGSDQVRALYDDITELGKNLENGNKELTLPALNAAIAKFKKDHPEIINKDFDNNYYDSPAKLLQLYASRAGELSRDIFGVNGVAPNSKFAAQLGELRESLLNKIAQPIAPKGSNIVYDTKAIAADLAEANAHYKKGFDLTGSKAQIEARQRRIEFGPSDEAATLPELMGLGVSQQTGPKQRFASTIKNISAISDYILTNKSKLKEIAGKDPAIKERLKAAFAYSLGNKLSGSLDLGGVNKGSVDTARKYLGSFTDTELLFFGIDEKARKQLNKDLTILQRLEDTKYLDMTGAATTANLKMKNVFETALKGDTTIEIAQNISNLVKNAKTKTQKENLRKGLWNYIISRESGVLKAVNEQNAYKDIGDDVFDVEAWSNLMDKLENSGAFKDILNKTFEVITPDGKTVKTNDKEMLSNLLDYARIVQSASSDAGSALSGAQLIGSLFTFDPEKLVGALARLSGQARVAQLFANKQFIQAITGTGKERTLAQKAKTYFTGGTAVGNIAATIVMGQINDADFQTEALFGGGPSMFTPDDPFQDDGVSNAIDELYGNVFDIKGQRF